MTFLPVLLVITGLTIRIRHGVVWVVLEPMVLHLYMEVSEHLQDSLHMVVVVVKVVHLQQQQQMPGLQVQY